MRVCDNSSASTQDGQHATVVIHTSLLFDSWKQTWRENVSLEVSPKSGNIVSIAERDSTTQIWSDDIDMRGLTVLPGLVDAHTHIFLHSYKDTPAIYQMRDESLIERVLRASNHLKAALKAGYTTYRDLGTEGLKDADVGVRNAVNRSIIPGPRLFVATEALASPGGYEVRIESRDQGSSTTRISDPCNGIEGVRAGVRRRLGAGADIIKFYGDYRRRQLRFPAGEWPGCPPIQHSPGDIDELDGIEVEDFRGDGNPLLDRNPASPLFTLEEMKAIVTEAKRAKCPVASHCSERETIVEAAQAGVTSIEHGWKLSEEAIAAMKEHNTIFVPTLAVLQAERNDYLADALEQVHRAWKSGIKLACGGDTGAFSHGENLNEPLLFEEAGIPLEDTLRALTLGGWEACGGDWSGRRFGSLEKGWAADLIAVKGDPRADGIKCLKNVEWVFKDAKVMVEQGHLVV